MTRQYYRSHLSTAGKTSFQRFVIERIQARGITVFDAAIDAGFGRNYFYDLVTKGKYDVRTRNVRAVAKVLHVTLDELLDAIEAR